MFDELKTILTTIVTGIVGMLTVLGIIPPKVGEAILTLCAALIVIFLKMFLNKNLGKAAK